VRDLPVVFVVVNNKWAISVPLALQTASRTLAQKAVAAGMPGIQVDGNDILAVYRAVTAAVDRARAGQGPTLVECVTYRMQVHTTADDPRRYRTDEELEGWKAKDPIKRFETYLQRKKQLSPKKIAGIEEDVQAQIQAAIDRAEELMTSMGDPLDMFDHAYAQMPPHLAAQREELAAELADDQKEGADG